MHKKLKLKIKYFTVINNNYTCIFTQIYKPKNDNVYFNLVFNQYYNIDDFIDIFQNNNEKIFLSKNIKNNIYQNIKVYIYDITYEKY